MRIALDYDDTFTNDEILWAAFVRNAKARGHSVTFVTFRKENFNNSDILADAELLGIDIVFCGLKQKASKFVADVWIDDSPHYIPTADTLKNHCEKYDVSYQLQYPLTETFDLQKGNV